jgi:hypothetical protein
MGITERELWVLRWVGEQYALPMAVVADLVGTPSAERLARRTAGRLERLGYADRRHAVGRWWLVPTRAGLRAAGLPYRVWDLAKHEWSLTHLVACARLRLHLAQAYPEARWESDRAIRAPWHDSGARVRLADGGLYFPDGDAVGIEVELHVKPLDRYQAAVADLDPAWSVGVWWFTPKAQVHLLQQRLWDAGGGGHHQVVTAPEGVAP